MLQKSELLSTLFTNPISNFTFYNGNFIESFNKKVVDKQLNDIQDFFKVIAFSLLMKFSPTNSNNSTLFDKLLFEESDKFLYIKYSSQEMKLDVNQAMQILVNLKLNENIDINKDVVCLIIDDNVVIILNEDDVVNLSNHGYKTAPLTTFLNLVELNSKLKPNVEEKYPEFIQKLEQKDICLFKNLINEGKENFMYATLYSNLDLFDSVNFELMGSISSLIDVKDILNKEKIIYEYLPDQEEIKTRSNLLPPGNYLCRPCRYFSQKDFDNKVLFLTMIIHKKDPKSPQPIVGRATTVFDPLILENPKINVKTFFVRRVKVYNTKGN